MHQHTTSAGEVVNLFYTGKLIEGCKAWPSTSRSFESSWTARSCQLISEPACSIATDNITFFYALARSRLCPFSVRVALPNKWPKRTIFEEMNSEGLTKKPTFIAKNFVDIRTYFYGIKANTRSKPFRHARVTVRDGFFTIPVTG